MLVFSVNKAPNLPSQKNTSTTVCQCPYTVHQFCAANLRTQKGLNIQKEGSAEESTHLQKHMKQGRSVRKDDCSRRRWKW